MGPQFHYVIFAAPLGQDSWKKIGSGTWTVGDEPPAIDGLPAGLLSDLFSIKVPSDAEGGRSVAEYGIRRYALSLTRLR